MVNYYGKNNVNNDQVNKPKPGGNSFDGAKWGT